MPRDLASEGVGWANLARAGVYSAPEDNPWGATSSRSGAGAYGAVPQLPSYTKDIQTSVGPDVYAQLTKNLPGYQSMVGASSGNIQNNLAGRVSSDVIAQLQQGGAERGIATGTEGSGANNAAYLRALGLTSMQLQQLGESQLTAAVGRTPIQQTQTGNQFSDLAAQQAIYNAAPNPTMAAGASIAAARAGMGAGFGGGPQAPSSGLGAMGYQAPYSPFGYGPFDTPAAAQDPYAGLSGIPGMSVNPGIGGNMQSPYGVGGLSYDEAVMQPTSYNSQNDTMYNNYGLENPWG